MAAWKWQCEQEKEEPEGGENRRAPGDEGQAAYHECVATTCGAPASSPITAADMTI